MKSTQASGYNRKSELSGPDAVVNTNGPPE